MPEASAHEDPGAAVARARQAMSEFGVAPEARTVRIRRVLPGPIERVWAYLTESDKRAKWLAAGPMELSVGGRIELNFQHADLSAEKTPPARFQHPEGGPRVRGRITRCEPPRLLSYTWHGGSGHESEVTFELSPEAQDVILLLTHRHLGDRSGMVSVASGWHTHLGILLDQLEGRAPRPFWTTFTGLEAEYERRLPAD